MFLGILDGGEFLIIDGIKSVLFYFSEKSNTVFFVRLRFGVILKKFVTERGEITKCYFIFNVTRFFAIKRQNPVLL